MRYCLHGHPWTAANTKGYRHSKNGSSYRVCRRCHADRERARYRPVIRERRPERPHFYEAREYPL